MSTPTEIAERRTRVRHLAQSGASNRRIADALGVSKDTVRRDLAAEPDPDEPPVVSQRERLAQRVAHAERAVSQACAAAQAVAYVRPAAVFTDDATAERWWRTLREAADQLGAAADAFAAYYPAATE
ncbi:helix-turn-helix domain-containing protein [Streptomyces erythrochromogenes]|uniref:helix-turn-helix domain-containing protein n=1 Tax=Streptomyces erythrochromogenes TaxID=285574 RepID=UPI00386E4224|nr:hypothetical protein OG364_17520 [Streptomyces erythrochromogenes]